MSTYYCRLCFLKCKPEESLLFSNYVTEMIQFCIPEVDMNLVNNPVLCSECYDKLEEVFKFKKKCLEVEENIKQRILSKGSCEGVDMSYISLKQEVSTTSADTEEIADCISAGASNFMENLGVDLSSLTAAASLASTNVTSTMSREQSSNITIQSNDPRVSSDPVNKIDSKHHSTTKCKSSRKLKIVRNIVDVKFLKKSCLSCRLSFETLDKLIHHLYSNHQKNGELYSCLLCRFKSINLSLMMKHYHISHKECKDLNASCFFCLTHFKSFEELFNHMTEKHNRICKLTRYNCNSCDFVSRSYVNFRKHYFQSHDLICNYCSKYCETVHILNRHLRNHSDSSKSHATIESGDR